MPPKANTSTGQVAISDVTGIEETTLAQRILRSQPFLSLIHI